MGKGRYEGRGTSIDTSAESIRRIAEHMMEDACTPGNPRESTVESLIPMVEHAMTGSY